ncbi:MAG TPA: CRTAC1 family protein [Bacteroidales bacterium]
MNTYKTLGSLFLMLGATACSMSLFSQQTKAKNTVVHGAVFESSPANVSFTDMRRNFGVAVVDMNNDSYPDLFFNNMTTPCDLYINKAGTEFLKTDTTDLIKHIGWATGQAWADYDNDGYMDFLLTYQDYSGNKLYHNNGKGGFDPVKTGLVVTDKGPSFHPAWADINNDGFVDLLVSNCTYFGDKKDTKFMVYLNDGKGNFKPFTDEVLTKLTESSSSSNFCDYDQDGDADLLVTTWGKGAFILKNEGNGIFKRLPDLEGANGNLITCTWVDYDNDGDFDIFITRGHPDEASNLLYQNMGNDKFVLVTGSEITKPMGNFWNAGWGDFDNDGDLDLCYTSLLKQNFLFENNGDGTFKPITDNIVVTDTSAKTGCSAVWADYDNDGDLDLVLCNIANGKFPIYRNKGNANHWLTLKCEGTTSNRAGIGAVVKIRTTIGGKKVWQIRQVASVEAFRAVNPILHFGLGDAPAIDEMIVTWPSGLVQKLKNIKADRFVTVKEGRSL